jgi:hypothetical protein
MVLIDLGVHLLNGDSLLDTLGVQNEEVQQINLCAHACNLFRIGLGDKGNTVLLEEVFQVGEGSERGDLFKCSLSAEMDNALGNRIGCHHSLGRQVREHVTKGQKTNRTKMW